MKKLLLSAWLAGVALGAACKVTPFPDGRLPEPVLLKSAATQNAAAVAPFQTAVSADGMIVRLRAVGGKNYHGPVEARLTDGDFQWTGVLKQCDWMNNGPTSDFALALPAARTFSPATRLAVSAAPPPVGQLEVYAVLPTSGGKSELADGIDFETPTRCGVWLAHGSGQLALDDQRGLRGQVCLRADWPDGGAMISLLPRERDWRKYAALRFTVANPLPTAAGRRTRIMFLYDGRRLERPTPHDSIGQGAIALLQESERTFELDLRKFAANHPQFDLSNVCSVQIFWSPVACGPTTLYWDDIRLMTAAELEAEARRGYEDQVNGLRRQMVDLQAKHASPELGRVLTELDRLFAAGDRDAVRAWLERCREIVTSITVAGDAESYRSLQAPTACKLMRDRIPGELRDFPAQIAAAGNERESFQLVLAPARPLQQVVVSAGELKNADGATLPAAAVAINPVGYLEVRANAFQYKDARPGMWPDVLQDNRPLDLPVRLQPYMVTVTVPAQQPPGVYRGEIVVRALGEPERRLPYELRVYDFSLPVRGKLKTWFCMAYLPENRELRKQVYDLYFAHRLNPTGMYSLINNPARPGVEPTQFLPPLEDLPYCLERGLNFMTIGMMLDRPARDPHRFDEAYIQCVIDWVRKNRSALIELGAWDVAYVNGFDEIMHHADTRAPRLKEARKICAALKKAVPDVKIANIGRIMDIDNSLMDAWFIAPEKQADFAARQRAGGLIAFYWAYQDPSFMLDQPGLAPRLCAWLAYREGAEGMGYYSTTRFHSTSVPPTVNERHQHCRNTCTEVCMPPNPPDGIDWKSDVFNIESTGFSGRNGDGVLFYPAPGGRLLGSQRAANLRDGIEDYEYFKILEALPGDHRRLLTIGPDVVNVRQGDYTTDITKLEARRRAVAEAIEAAVRNGRK